MTFEMALRENGINPNSDLLIDTSIAFAAMQGTFIGGTGDFVTLFEPNATQVEKLGYGYVVASVGELGGSVPYTAYNAKKSFIENNKDVIKGFRNAINKALEFVKNNDSKTVASAIIDFFPDTSLDDLTSAVERYKSIGAWKDNTNISKSDYERLEEIMNAAGELDKDEYVDYKELFIND